jgi:hypothetical protein
MNQPAKRRPTVTSEIWTMFWSETTKVTPRLMITTSKMRAKPFGTYLVDDKVHVASRDHLPVEQVLFVADTANRPAGGLDGHHLLNHLFFVRVKEAREFRGVE